MTPAQRALGSMLEYVHPIERRRSLRRQVRGLVAEVVRERREAAERVCAERVEAVLAAQRDRQALVAAAAVLAGSGQRFSPASTARLLREVPLREDGSLDEDTFAVTAFDEAAAYAEEMSVPARGEEGST